MIRSAFLIVAHNNFEMLKFLIKSLDSEEHDIYIHIDKKCGDIDYSQFESITKFSHVKCLRDRINVFWGGVSQIQSTLNTLETAIFFGGGKLNKAIVISILSVELIFLCFLIRIWMIFWKKTMAKNLLVLQEIIRT